MDAPSLYIHIPFCARQCDFCTFYVEPLADGRVKEFLDALDTELTLLAGHEPFTPRTIFLGGGTPSILTTKQFEHLFARICARGLLVPTLEEFSIEAMPATITSEKADLWRAYGVNRVSLGVQSLDPALLEKLGRQHDVAAVHKSFDLLRAAGFDNLNLDLIFAIPGQTAASWRDTLVCAIALDPEHFSTYELTYEEGSVMTAQMHAGEFAAVDVETAAAMYETGIEMLAAAGYAQYEISNFAKPNCRSLHNLNYWHGGDCLALGPSAAGYWRGTRYKNIPDLDQYINRLGRGEHPVAFAETLAPRQRAGELAAFALRMNDGVVADWFRKTSGFTLHQLWPDEIVELCAAGFADFNGQRLRLTRSGQLVADDIAERFVILPEVASIRP